MKQGLCPDFPIYAGDWLSSLQIAQMTAAEEGGYWRLLLFAWGDPDCCLPDDDSALAAMSRLSEAWAAGSGQKIRQCFQADPGRPGFIFNARQRRERVNQIARLKDAHARCAKMRDAKAAKRGRPCKGHLQGSSKGESKSLTNALSSPVSPLPSPVSPNSLLDTHTPSTPKGHEGSNAPFPGEKEALEIGTKLNIPAAFVKTVWNEAQAIGGKDRKGQPIKSWSHWLKARWDKHQQWQAQHPAQKRTNHKTVTPNPTGEF